MAVQYNIHYRRDDPPTSTVRGYIHHWRKRKRTADPKNEADRV